MESTKCSPNCEEGPSRGGYPHSGAPIRWSWPQDQQSLKPKLTLAAKYVRMSTEQQRYSIDNQVEAINRHQAPWQSTGLDDSK
jgi:hypothetical protein